MCASDVWGELAYILPRRGDKAVSVAVQASTLQHPRPPQPTLAMSSAVLATSVGLGRYEFTPSSSSCTPAGPGGDRRNADLSLQVSAQISPP